jgi:predicted nucleotidyltransferase component of viral defense system
MVRKKTFKLNHAQEIIIAALAKSPLRDLFYWTGGTALAYHYLGHRHSYDVDLFSSRPFELEQVLPFVRDLKTRHGFKNIEQKKVYDRWEFFLHNGYETRLEFVFYDFGQLKKPEVWRGVRVDSLDDMAANKMVALVERHEPKDIVDIYCMMAKKKYTVDRFLALAKKKFDVSFPRELFWAEALRAGRNLTKIRPLFLGSEKQQLATIAKITTFVERGAAECLHRMIDE